jgi:hypothetical protein
MKVRITKEDAVFSKLIRLRDGFTCQVCGTYFTDGHGLQCSHFFSRRHQATRYDPLNAAAKCFSCHQYLGENPIEFDGWIRKYLGEGAYELLKEKHHRIVKRTKKDRAALYAHLKGELRKLERAMNHGEPLPAVVGFD